MRTTITFVTALLLRRLVLDPVARMTERLDIDMGTRAGIGQLAADALRGLADPRVREGVS